MLSALVIGQKLVVLLHTFTSTMADHGRWPLTNGQFQGVRNNSNMQGDPDKVGMADLDGEYLLVVILGWFHGGIR